MNMAVLKYFQKFIFFMSPFLIFIVYLFIQWLINPSFISFDVPAFLNFLMFIAFLVYLILAMIVYQIIKFMYKEIGNNTLLLPLILGLLTFGANYNTGIWSGESAMTFWWFELPFLLTSVPYSIGFVIRDKFSVKEIKTNGKSKN